MQTQSQQMTLPARKPYAAPVLEEYGLVKELTRTSAPTPYGADAGTFPTNYNSIPN